LDDLIGETVATGQWFYAGEVRKSVEIVAFSYDYYFELPAIDGRDPWTPYPLNEDGVLLYVRADGGDPLGEPPFQTILDAKAWANSQPWAPIDWLD
jgi:hypothetical protein